MEERRQLGLGLDLYSASAGGEKSHDCFAEVHLMLVVLCFNVWFLLLIKRSHWDALIYQILSSPEKEKTTFIQSNHSISTYIGTEKFAILLRFIGQV